MEKKINSFRGSSQEQEFLNPGNWLANFYLLNRKMADFIKNQSKNHKI
jgi:hypothetical protein